MNGDAGGSGLHRIACRIGADKPLYQHLVVGDDTWLWVDTGIRNTPDDFLWDYLDRTGLTPAPRQLAVITHPDVDHYGGLARMRSRLPQLIAGAHEWDAPLIAAHDVVMTQRYLVHGPAGVTPSPERRAQLLERAGQESGVDLLLTGGETFDLGSAGSWRVLHLPGHSRGHLGLWRERTKEAIIGDALLGWGTPNCDGLPVQAPPYFDVPGYLNTIEQIAELAPQTLYTSHFPLLTGAMVGDFLASCREAVRQIGDAVAAAMSGRGGTLEQLCRRVHSSLRRWPAGTELTLADAVSAHLADLGARTVGVP
jgi:glyoxylase-like metal-dependent hydrolase (beta-lactamase superfamily II)